MVAHMRSYTAQEWSPFNHFIDVESTWDATSTDPSKSSG